MCRQNRIEKRATKVTYWGEGTISVRYWATDVVRITPTKIVLDNGGYDTVTTRSRMNQASRQFDLAYSVFQRNGERNGTGGTQYVQYNGETKAFERRVTLDRENGTILAVDDVEITRCPFPYSDDTESVGETSNNPAPLFAD